ncbi:MAG: hypothetical protein KGO22_15055 [Gammaproteobacteria bacterium]|nr:hypothetical protein [Gammaproteobacteria bacterium]
MRPFRLAFAGALCGVLLAGSCSIPLSAQASPAQAAVPQVRDGSHDFDFLYGSWLMHNRRLAAPVLTSHDWGQFDSTDEARPLPGGLGNEDTYRASWPRKGFVGQTIRLYDRDSGLWRIYWIDNLKSHGDPGAPNVGRWQGNVGIFDESLTVQGKPAIDRYTWTRFGDHSRIAAHFEESLSVDGGRTWKVVFANDLIRAAPTAASAQSAEGRNLQQASAKVRDGSHDFDFEYGKWRMPNHRLLKRLAGSHDWADFVSCDEGWPLPGGIGDMDVYRTSYWPNFVGMTLRTYDPQTGLWRLYWFDNRFSHGVIEPPVVGRFDGRVGVFEGPDTFDGKPITVRYVWTVSPKGSKTVAKWRQAFSTDGGKTWEVNWRNELVHDERCELTAARS